MSRATPQMHDFAERLIAYESKRTKAFAPPIPVAFQVCGKLRPHLATLMGKAGFGALLSRALALAAVEAPGLRAVQVQADGSLVIAGATEGAAKVGDGGVHLLAQLLGLLEAFIGENLTLRMLREVWPKLFLSELYFRNEDQK